MLAKLKESYDFIVLDTPPVGLVADAMQIMPFWMDFYVVRHNYTQAEMFDFVNSRFEEGVVKNVSIIMNDVGQKVGYGYGYGYGYATVTATATATAMVTAISKKTRANKGFFGTEVSQIRTQQIKRSMKIIAESAFNHNGDVRYLIELAKKSQEAGADFFTFQIMDLAEFCDIDYAKYSLS